MEEPPAFQYLRRTSTEQRPFNVLFSEPSDELLLDYLVELIHSVLPPGRIVATVIPPGIREKELVETAAGQRFDLAIIMLNNVFYAPYDLARRASTLTADGVLLVEKLKRICEAPIIALYGWPRDDDSHVTNLLRAGAAAAFQLPFRTLNMQRALAQCLDAN